MAGSKQRRLGERHGRHKACVSWFQKLHIACATLEDEQLVRWATSTGEERTVLDNRRGVTGPEAATKPPLPSHLDDLHRCVADGPRPQVLQQVARLDATKLNVCGRERGFRGVRQQHAGFKPCVCAQVRYMGQLQQTFLCLGAPGYDMPAAGRVPADSAPEMSRTKPHTSHTCILVVPHQARLPCLHEGARCALTEIVQHQLNSLHPFPIDGVEQRNPLRGAFQQGREGAHQGG